MRPRRRLLAALACLGAGAAALVIMNHPVAVIAGLVLLVAAVVLGATGLLTDDVLAPDPPADDAEAPRR